MIIQSFESIKSKHKPNRVGFRLSKKKESEEILWTYSHRSTLQKWCSKLALPKFSKLLTRKLKALERKRDGWTSKIKLNEETARLLSREFNSLYNKEDYQSILSTIEKGWRKIEKGFFEQARLYPQISIHKIYICYLTFYGGGGSFGKKNQIYVRVNPRIPSDLRLANYTIMHELLHLMSGSYAQKKHYTHNEREKLVDSMINNPMIRKLLK